MKKTLFCMVAVAVAFSSLFLLTADSSAQWSAKVLTAHGGQFPSISIDSKDIAHIATFDSNRIQGPALRYLRVNKDGKVIFDKLIDKENAGAWTAIAVDSKNRAHIAYQAGGAGPGLKTTLRYAVDDGVHWTITDVSPGGCAASLLLDLNGNPEIAQIGGAGCAGPLEYDWFDGSSWHTDPLGISADTTSATGIAQGNLLNIVFTEPSGALMDGEDGASGWTFTQIAPSGRDASISWPYVAYTNTAQDDADYATSNGALWSSSIIAASASDPKIGFSGTTKVCYIDDTNQELTYARLDNGAWSATSLGTGYGASAIALNEWGVPSIATQSIDGASDELSLQWEKVEQVTCTKVKLHGVTVSAKKSSPSYWEGRSVSVTFLNSGTATSSPAEGGLSILACGGGPECLPTHSSASFKVPALRPGGSFSKDVRLDHAVKGSANQFVPSVGITPDNTVSPNAVYLGCSPKAGPIP